MTDPFDPGLVPELKNSHALPQMQELFRAIAGGKRRPDLWGMLNKITQKLSAEERNRLSDLFMAELKKSDT